MAALSPQTSRTERPRAVSALSHASTHSHGTFRSRDNNKVEKIDLTEHSSDKKRLEGKSDPTKALNEAQPAAVALEHSNLEDIRVGQYKDRDGNIITDPDRCNPTRPRMERPLDTIRQFNAAAEGTTSRRSSYQRPPSFSGMEGQSRRTSQYGGPPNSMYSQNGRPGPRAPQGNGGYYRNSSYNMRPDYQEDGGPVQQGPPRAHHGRYQSQPYMQPGDSPTSVHSHQPSYETMTSGSDENSKSTNPSSQNSSYDQLHQMGPPKHQGEYPHNPHRQNGGPMRNPYPPSAMPNGFNNGYNNGYSNGHSNGHSNGYNNGYSNGYGQRSSGPTDDYGMEFQQSAPLPPPKRFEDGANGAAPLRMTLQKTNSNSQTQRVQEEPKRQSWIKRRFSKKA